MKNITVIVPLHKFDEEIKPLLDRALKSVPKGMNISVSCGSKVKDEDVRYLLDEFTDITLLKSADNDESDDFCTLVNRSVGVIGTKWFSILEFDDVYTDIWFKNVCEGIEYNPDVSVFLPLEELVNYQDNKFIGYGNEAPWATSFSNEIGMIDNDCLQEFFDFYLTGGVFNTEDWLNNGGLKPSIKLTFWYEFLLRITNNSKKVMVIPKLGYKHYVNRNGSLYSEYRKTVTEDESDWWFELAKQECFYNEDRHKTYDKNNEKGE